MSSLGFTEWSHQITRKMCEHLSPMILHCMCLILCLKWHDTCPACSSRLWPRCVPRDLPSHFWTTLIKPTQDTWPKGSNQQSDLIREGRLGLLGLWNAKVGLVGIGGMEGCTRYFKELPMEVEPRRSTCSCWPAQSCMGPTITGLAVSSWIPGSCLHQSMYVPSIDTPPPPCR